MLLQHSFVYSLSRGVPGLVGFFTIMVYTRLLSPEVYGQYTLVMTGAIVANAVLYRWLNAALLRFLPQYIEKQSELLIVILAGFVSASILLGGVGASLLLILKDSVWCGFVAIGVFLTMAQAWFSINLDLVRSRLIPFRYGVISLLKSIIALGLGAFLVLCGYGAYGALNALFIGFLAAGLWASWGHWDVNYEKWQSINRNLIKRLLVYGLPLTASFALSVVISSTDRFMLAGLINTSATGMYAAGQGLAQQSIGIIMTAVNLAAYPLIVRALELNGHKAARSQIRKNVILLLSVSLPVATVFVILAPNIAGVFLGKEFQVVAVELMPWAAIATLLSGIRVYWLDIAFHLGEKTYLQSMVMFAAVGVNIFLNLWLIPLLGLMGAVYATVAAHCVAVLLSAMLGNFVFRMPKMYGDISKLLIATLAMVSVLFLLPNGEGFARLCILIVIGVAVYLGFIIALDVGGIRRLVKKKDFLTVSNLPEQNN